MIKKLPEEVIIKIAAGEVIERPYNALKQLIENSIDAESTAIYVSISQGGLSKLEIVDNGKGVHPEDYPLLCERFATSKLTTYEDLQKIGSFGFRGQALASLSYVGNVEVISRVRESNLGYKAEFKDGKLLGQLTPVPRNAGTSIKILNLFMNLQARRKSLSGNEQKRRILKLINNMALHCSGIRFQLVSDKGSQLKIDPLPDKIDSKLRLFSQMSTLDKSSIFYSQFVIDSVSVSGVFSKLSVSKSKTLILFINNRLVQYSNVYKAIQRGYSTCYSSIHQHLQTFNVYLSLQLDPKYVDCNIHPTKKEVRIIGSQKFCEGLNKWIIDIVKNNCKIKSIGKIEPIIFTQKAIEKRDQLNYQKVRNSPSQLPLKYFINQSSKPMVIEDAPKMDITIQDINGQKNTQQNITKTNKSSTPLKMSFISSALQPIPQCIPPIKKQNQRSGQQLRQQIQQYLNPETVSHLLKDQTPFILTISQEVLNTPHSMQVKQFVKEFTYVGCYNLNYIFIQYKLALLFLNILPFLYPTLINHLKKTEMLYLQRTQEMPVLDLLYKLKIDKKIDFDAVGYNTILYNFRQIISSKLHIYINQKGNVFQVCYPAQCLEGKYTSLEIGYLLARIGKILTTKGDLDIAICQKYLIQYFTKLFKSEVEIKGKEHTKVSQFLENKIIPRMKTKTHFPQIEVSKYLTKVVEQKSLYSIFERC